MAKQGRDHRLETITQSLQGAGKTLPPVHLWNPPYCGEIDMRVAADGTWYYQDTPISRPALVRLFASVLKREGERYYLVTPVEKCGIQVDDAPFLAVDLQAEGSGAGRTLRFRTNMDEEVLCGRDHPLRFAPQPGGGLKPYLHVRADLWALATRPVYYELVELGEERETGRGRWFGVCSQGEFFAMAPASELDGLTA